MNGSELQKVYDYRMYPNISDIYSDKVFISLNNGSMGGSHWCCFILKDKKSSYFDSFSGQLDQFLRNQLPKPIIYHNSKNQDTSGTLSGCYCFYFFCSFERKNYYDAVLKIYFG